MDLLPKNLKWLRLARSLSQEQLAKAAGVAQSTISRVEKGAIGSVKHTQVVAIADFFGVSLDDLARHDFEAGPPTEKTSRAAIDLDSLSSALVAFDKTLKALKVPYDHMQDMARTLRFAYDYLAERPEMTKMERQAFDLALIQKMTEDIHAAAARDGSRTQASHRGRSKGAKA